MTILASDHLVVVTLPSATRGSMTVVISVVTIIMAATAPPRVLAKMIHDMNMRQKVTGPAQEVNLLTILQGVNPYKKINIHCPVTNGALFHSS